jgi:GalNAc-alpha-(1->4)-GalNAc-alpha-(1->3)-diNAcBac-PP-undecaprenol alpha-1,4-N-acetyl-D-galactosaminyltransferase
LAESDNLMEKKKLCLVIPSLQAGGMERVMSELSGYFATKHDFEQHLILYGINREIFYSIPESIIIHRPAFTFNNRWRFFYTIKTIYYLRKTVNKINPYSILSFGELWNSFVLIALLGLNLKIYISDRCSPEKKLSVIHSFLRRLLYPRAKGIIAQTLKAKEIYTNQFSHNNIKVIGNPIREIPSSNENIKQNIVLMVGRLIKSKNQDKLIELFLNIKMPGWKLILVGYDHLQQNNYAHLQEIIKHSDAEDRVFLEGKQADVESFYRRSKIFAFTSSSEGFPNVIGEALSAGLPVVSFDCVAGPSEMIHDSHNGFLVQLFNYTMFQEKLEILMKDDDLRIRFGENARNDIKQFSVANIGEKYLQFITGEN